MQGLAMIFFGLFAVVLVGMYLAIRRQWAAPGITAGVGVLLSIVSMMLVSLAQNNETLLAIIIGVVIGGLFSGATLAIAWYFQSNEMQQRARFAGDMGDEGAQE